MQKQMLKDAPQWCEALKEPARLPVPRDIVGYYLGSSPSVNYGKIDHTGLAIHPLSVDVSGRTALKQYEPTPIGDGPGEIPRDSLMNVERWGKKTSKDDDMDTRPIMGIVRQKYPLDKGWQITDGEDILRLSQVTVRRATKCLPRRKARPNSEKTWPPKLGIFNLPFILIWRASGSFLASVADEKVMQKIKHRALFLLYCTGRRLKSKKQKMSHL